MDTSDPSAWIATIARGAGVASSLGRPEREDLEADCVDGPIDRQAMKTLHFSSCTSCSIYAEVIRRNLGDSRWLESPTTIEGKLRANWLCQRGRKTIKSDSSANLFDPARRAGLTGQSSTKFLDTKINLSNISLDFVMVV